jgi:hypothetical protein
MRSNISDGRGDDIVIRTIADVLGAGSDPENARSQLVLRGKRLGCPVRTVFSAPPPLYPGSEYEAGPQLVNGGH